LKLKRKYLFEFEDFKWYPTDFRNIQTDFLQFIMQRFDVFSRVYPRLFEVVTTTKIYHFTDLCSGGGGAILQLRKHFKTTFTKPFKAVLTDLYPNKKAFQELYEKSNGEISFIGESVDVKDDLQHLKGIWTVFNAFHHLSPLHAVRLLSQAKKYKKPIAVMEPLDRNIFMIFLQSFFLIIGLFFFIPFAKSFNFKAFLFTYLLPLIPLFIIWDGWISVLKVYNPDILLKMTTLADPDKQFNWKVGYEKHQFGKVIYLIGMP